jgi:hypothetical protein
MIKKQFLLILFVSLGFTFVNAVYSADQIINTSDSSVPVANAATPVYAAEPASCFDQITPGEDSNLGSWAANAIGHVTINLPLKFVAGEQMNCDKCLVGTPDSSCGIPDVAALNNSATGQTPLAYDKGAIGMAGTMLDEMIREPLIQTDLALFIDDTFKDNIFSNEAYAQGKLSTPNNTFRLATYHAWKVSRNASLILLSSILALAALMVIFNKKLSPQVTISVYSVLPTIPVAIGLILLSYPIVAIAMNIMELLQTTASQLGQSIVQEMGSGGGGWMTVGALGCWCFICNIC